MAIISTGVLIFIVSLSLNVYYTRKDNSSTKELAFSIVKANKKQLVSFDAIKKIIERVNNMKLNVRFSQISLEKFRLGNFLEGINTELQTSYQKAKYLQNDFFYSNKNGNYLRILLISLSVLIILFLFIVIYKRRQLSMSLILTACMVLLMIFSLNSLGILFTNFSINVEICDQAIKIFNPKYGDIRFRMNQHFNEFLTCFSFKGKQSLKIQMTSNMIAVNSVLIILKNFFAIENNTFVSKGYFDNVNSALENKTEVLEKLEDVLNKGDSESYYLISNYLNMLSLLNTLNVKIENLMSCQYLKSWARDINKSMCRYGLNYQFYSSICFLCKFFVINSYDFWDYYYHHWVIHE